MDYRSMARNSILSRDDIDGWINDLTDTNQFSLADSLLRVKGGREISDERLYAIAWYLCHCDNQR